MPNIATQFFGPRLPVTIVSLPEDNSAVALRGILEDLGCSVTLHGLGTPCDLLLVLKHEHPRYLVVAGHGGENGLYFGQYGPGIDVSLLQEGYLPAAAISSHVDLRGALVLMDGCFGGAMTAPLLAGGASAVIGCPVEIGPAMTLFTIHFFYAIRERKMTDRDAFAEAIRAIAPADDEPIQWFE